MEKCLQRKDEYYQKGIVFLGLTICLLIGLLFSVEPMIIISIGSLLCIVCGYNNTISMFCGICTLCIIVLLVYLEFYSFTFLPQAYTLLEKNNSILFWITVGHYHSIRLLIVYPSYLFSIYFGLPLDVSFGYYCSITFALMAVFLVRISVEIKKSGNIAAIAMITAAVIVMLASYMNGRGCFGLLGYSMILYAAVIQNKNEKETDWIQILVCYLTGAVLSTVSSGMLIVCTLFIVFQIILFIINNKGVNLNFIGFLGISIMLFPAILIGTRYIIRMIIKNIDYFGGGIAGCVNMLQHGVGQVLEHPSVFLLAALLMLALVIFAWNIIFLTFAYKKYHNHFQVVVAGNIAFYGMFFGLTTGTLIIIPLLIEISFALNYYFQFYLDERKNYY